MGYKYFNNNPNLNITEDCAVRAISKVLNISWDDAFDLLTRVAKNMGVMPSSKDATAAVLRMNGFYRETFPDCYKCYTVRDFAERNPVGKYVLDTGSHVVAVVDGDWYDMWDSHDETVYFFWTR